MAGENVWRHGEVIAKDSFKELYSVESKINLFAMIANKQILHY